MWRLSKFNLDLANNSDGWSTYNELKWLAKQARKHHTIVEIGCYHGRSTRAMADNSSAIIYAVDDFKGVRDKAITPLPHFEMFYGNLQDHINSGRVVVVVADHQEIPELPRPDMVFIDGSHLYEDVKRDIEYWLPRVLPGGLICGHDVQFQQVSQAVKETVGKYKVGRGTTIWYTKIGK